MTAKYDAMPTTWAADGLEISQYAQLPHLKLSHRWGSTSCWRVGDIAICAASSFKRMHQIKPPKTFRWNTMPRSPELLTNWKRLQYAQLLPFNWWTTQDIPKTDVRLDVIVDFAKIRDSEDREGWELIQVKLKVNQVNMNYAERPVVWHRNYSFCLLNHLSIFYDMIIVPLLFVSLWRFLSFCKISIASIIV